MNFSASAKCAWASRVSGPSGGGSGLRLRLRSLARTAAETSMPRVMGRPGRSPVGREWLWEGQIGPAEAQRDDVVAHLATDAECLTVAPKATRPDDASWHQMHRPCVAPGQTACRMPGSADRSHPANRKPSMDRDHATHRMPPVLHLLQFGSEVPFGDRRGRFVCDPNSDHSLAGFPSARGSSQRPRAGVSGHVRPDHERPVRAAPRAVWLASGNTRN